MTRAVIFDFNGVIVDDEQLHFELFRDVLADEGVALDAAAYHAHYLGYDDRGCFAAVLADAGRSASTSVYIDALIARKAMLYQEAASRSLKFFPGVRESIEDLHSQGLTLAVCSGALRAEVEFALGLIGVRDCFATIVAAEDVQCCKPDPEGYLLVLKQLSVVDPKLTPALCLVIEDSLAGVAAARAAGLRCLGVTNTYSERELLEAGADGVVGSLANLRVNAVREAMKPALVLCRDLIFATKIEGTARAVGRPARVVGAQGAALSLIEQLRPSLVILDLAAGNDLVGPAAVVLYRAAAPPSCVLLAFGSHVDVDALEAARLAGCDVVMPRSKFSAELPALLSAAGSST